MKQKIRLARGREDQREEVERVVRDFDSLGTLLHDSRNKIRSIATQHGQWNVKRYHVPALLNRVVYTLFRKPKGLRAFLNPARLLSVGLDTPRPIAYVEQRKGGLLAGSYFVCEQCTLSRRFYELGSLTSIDSQTRELLTRFAQTTARMHEGGILHRDYSPGNILFDRVDGEWRFSFVDLNRMSFRRVGIREGCRNFARLWGPEEMFRIMAREYAAARGADPAECERLVLKARRKFWVKRFKKGKKTYPFQLAMSN